ncbi:helicase-related protein [Pedobacter sp. BAL39]|uniref:ATP-dependent DNA helicase n=1 Tax=Pedobacter sp. BAL39 TaxID=391596 RepID=UPI0001559510|nr:AAA family ATPase [Pedobacter sp. BAL39]EDM36676.1 helicase-related protein [Pedobacter sp. BAL39]
MSHAVVSNEIFDQVIDFISYTNQNIFLTGKAGTGKTTLLRKIQATTAKKNVIVAPTGVAAMNAKGVTINSMFQLPPGTYFPGDVNLANLKAGIVSIPAMVADLTYTRERRTLLTEMDLMIIDEVSMVRCDVLDAVDAILRTVRKNELPFGGVQLLLIGDLYQLPPVTKREDWELLSKIYPSPYFFDARVIRQNPLLQVELKQVFRQTEPEFVDILNDIRNNQINDARLELLNKRYNPDFKAAPGDNHIIITSHNAEANQINNAKLEELEGPEYTYEGQIDGTFNPQILPVEQSLRLKKGAQVMFIKNDTGENRKFYNGKIGTIKSIHDQEIYISFPDTDEEDLLLERSSWQSFDYKANNDEQIEQQQVGEFFQYPVKLAWAVTIHKSQGLTFDSAIIDAGNSFISGQVYVALSRVRTLNGLILRSKINKESLRSNAEVIAYMKMGAGTIPAVMLQAGKERYLVQLITNVFSFHQILAGQEKIASDSDMIKSSDAELKGLIRGLGKSATALAEVSQRFQSQLRQLPLTGNFENQELIQSRIDAALTYFSKEVTMQLINLVNKQIRTKPKNKLDQKVIHLMQAQRTTIEHALSKMRSIAEWTADESNWKDPHAFIEKIRGLLKSKPNSPSAAQNTQNLQLF